MLEAWLLSGAAPPQLRSAKRVIDHRLEKLGLKRANIIRSELEQSLANACSIPAQSLDLYAAAQPWKLIDPPAHAQEHFHRPNIIAAFNLVISDSHLQDAAIEVSPGGLIFLPGFLENFMRFEVFAPIEQFNPLDSQARDWFITGLRKQCCIVHTAIIPRQISNAVAL